MRRAIEPLLFVALACLMLACASDSKSIGEVRNRDFDPNRPIAVDAPQATSAQHPISSLGQAESVSLPSVSSSATDPGTAEDGLLQVTALVIRGADAHTHLCVGLAQLSEPPSCYRSMSVLNFPWNQVLATSAPPIRGEWVTVSMRGTIDDSGNFSFVELAPGSGTGGNPFEPVLGCDAEMELQLSQNGAITLLSSHEQEIVSVDPSGSPLKVVALRDTVAVREILCKAHSWVTVRFFFVDVSRG